MRKLTIALAAIAFALILAGCAPDKGGDAQRSTVSVGSLKGPTSIGLAGMMDEDSGYEFAVVGTADEIVPMLSQDELDIALIPANLAATLYHKTDGAIRVIDINTLGVLYAVSEDTSIERIGDLAGRTVYMTGKGTVPEFSFAALLAEADMSPNDLTIEFRSEPGEVAALVTASPGTVGILPQPYVAAATLQNPSLSVVLDLTEEWAKATESDKGGFVTGVTVARAEFIEDNPEEIGRFLELHAKSASKANDDPASIAQKVVELGIVGKEEIAVMAIPACNAVCITGDEMRLQLEGYLAALYGQSPASVGGEMPDERFYHIG